RRFVSSSRKRSSRARSSRRLQENYYLVGIENFSVSGTGQGLPAVLMLGYTYYESDSRVIREAEAAVDAGFEVDFLALRRAGSPRTESIRGVRVVRLAQEKYRGRGH